MKNQTKLMLFMVSFGACTTGQVGAIESKTDPVVADDAGAHARSRKVFDEAEISFQLSPPLIQFTPVGQGEEAVSFEPASYCWDADNENGMSFAAKSDNSEGVVSIYINYGRDEECGVSFQTDNRRNPDGLVTWSARDCTAVGETTMFNLKGTLTAVCPE